MNGRQYSEELNKLNDEISDLDRRITDLRQKRRSLVEKRQQIESALERHVGQLEDQSEQIWGHERHPWSPKLRQLLQTSFKMKEFRPLQLATMNASIGNEDVICIMSTGGGKSLCYQLPALLKEGITLVISPLVSLMEDQVLSLRRHSIDAGMMSASTSKEETNRLNVALTDSKSQLRLLYATPEKLSKSKRFMAKLEKVYAAGRLSLIAIDEVHCCSQWGHDFRPDYKFLNMMRRQFPKTAILGLTATATANVLDDVKDMLGIPGALLFRSGFNRSNLRYTVRLKPKEKEAVMDDMASLIQGRFAGKSGIIYCFSRKESEEVAAALRQKGIKAGHYHADMELDDRTNVHQRWIRNKIQVIVATVAFGMGIDKSDVSFVIHHSLAKSMENYYQESGRAGRDHSSTADCILYYRFQDVFRQSTMVCTEKTGLEKLYPMVEYAVNFENQCRRMLIAKHFEEPWEPDWCQVHIRANLYSRECVTFCCLESSVIEKCVTDEVKQLIGLAQESIVKKQKITMPKLMETWQKSIKGKENQRVRDNADKILAYLLLKGYLKEDFHFTPYSIISYAQPGPQAEMIIDGSCNKLIVPIPLLSTKLKDSASSSKSPSSNNQDDVEIVKKKRKVEGSEASDSNVLTVDLE